MNDLGNMLENFESDAKVCMSTILKGCLLSTEIYFVKSQRVCEWFNHIRNTNIWKMVSGGEQSFHGRLKRNAHQDICVWIQMVSEQQG